jgi:UDP-N-acetylglucosamine 2-epimerase (non-hydrolysing)
MVIDEVKLKTERKRILIFIGARPNIPKAWTLLRALDSLAKDHKKLVAITVVHSGQHYDENLGEGFATQLGVGVDVNLEVGSGTSDADQLSLLLSRCDAILDNMCSDCVVVMGDVNTTLAAAIVASRRGLPIVHLEAGLRSRRCDPEEINRKIITACSNYHLAPSTQAVNNLLSEGIEPESIFLVGNTMAETFIRHESSRRGSTILSKLNLTKEEYILFTVHKSANISKMDWLVKLLFSLGNVRKVIFPCHPHTLKLLRQSYTEVFYLENVVILDPLCYCDFGQLMENSYCTVTDSAGLQEECTVADVPCITLGLETARPETVLYGSNNIVGYDIDLCLKLLRSPVKRGLRPAYWDDQVGKRISEAFLRILQDIETIARNKKWTIRP